MSKDPLFDPGLMNVAIIESLYESYCEDPQSVDPSWRAYFDEMNQEAFQTQSSTAEVVQAMTPQPAATPPPPAPVPPPVTETIVEKVYVSKTGDLRIFNLIEAYRSYGHLMADFNPIRTDPIHEPRELSLSTLGFHVEELNSTFPAGGLLDTEEGTLQEIIDALRETYCEKIGLEYMGLQNYELEHYLQEKIEPNRFKIQLSMEEKQRILQNLNKSELFESFLHTKYVGQKRFSLEGGETLIPMLDSVLLQSAKAGMTDVILGMAHRGRLNVLANIMNKSYSDIFSEFDESFVPDSVSGSGDVKYHKGFRSTLNFEGHELTMELTSNPSHLEAVNAVVEGMARAKQVKNGGKEGKQQVLPILIHGDAAVAGQGIVYEVMQFRDLPGYGTGGTIHIVINNQIGFTTLPQDSRSTRYCTDIARAFGSPVFHVNGEDPEGCVHAMNLAFELRQRFQCDVFIDLNCYRKFGHNEGDEPAFTQPLEYKMIRKKKIIREIYRDDLIQQGVLEKYMAETLEEKFKKSPPGSVEECKAGSAKDWRRKGGRRRTAAEEEGASTV